MKITPDYYIVGKKKYDRVTRVLDIIKDAGNYKIPDDVMANAMSRGRRFHEITSRIDECEIMSDTNGVLLGLKAGDPEMYKMVMTYKQWHGSAIGKPLYSERPLINKDYGYAGTPDFVAIIKGDSDPTVIEKKTSSIITIKNLFQLHAYMKMTCCIQGMIVQITKDGKLHKVRRYKFDEDIFLAFAGLLKYHQMNNKIKL